MMERRKIPRLRVTKDAKIVLGTSLMIDCVVHDLTTVGARVEIQDAIDLPEVVDVTFDGGHTFRSCRLRWRKSNEGGVKFVRRELATKPVGPPRVDGIDQMQTQQIATALAPCPKCHSGMTRVVDIPHPLAPNMLKSTFLCRPCNRTRTYVLPASARSNSTVVIVQPRVA